MMEEDMSLEDLTDILQSKSDWKSENKDTEQVFTEGTNFVLTEELVNKFGELLESVIGFTDELTIAQLTHIGLPATDKNRARMFNTICGFMWCAAVHRHIYNQNNPNSTLNSDDDLTYGWSLGGVIVDTVMEERGYGLDDDGEIKKVKKH